MNFVYMEIAELDGQPVRRVGVVSRETGKGCEWKLRNESDKKDIIYSICSVYYGYVDKIYVEKREIESFDAEDWQEEIPITDKKDLPKLLENCLIEFLSRDIDEWPFIENRNVR